jgi:prevent-host-death family protein
MSAKDAKNSFGLLLDSARAEPVQVEKHGRPVVVVVSIEEFQRLSGANPAPGHASDMNSQARAERDNAS